MFWCSLIYSFILTCVYFQVFLASLPCYFLKYLLCLLSDCIEAKMFIKAEISVFIWPLGHLDRLTLAPCLIDSASYPGQVYIYFMGSLAVNCCTKSLNPFLKMFNGR